MTVILVYSKPRCMPCKQTIDALLAEGHEFHVRPVTPEVAEELFQWYGYREAPVVIHKNRGTLVSSWSGFQPAKIAEISNA